MSLYAVTRGGRSFGRDGFYQNPRFDSTGFNRGLSEFPNRFENCQASPFGKINARGVAVEYLPRLKTTCSTWQPSGVSFLRAPHPRRAWRWSSDDQMGLSK